jgi:hypothetical protein
MCIDKPEEDKLAMKAMDSDNVNEEILTNSKEEQVSDHHGILLKQSYDSYTLPSVKTRKEQQGMTASTSHPCLETNISTLLPVTGKHPLQQPTIVDKMDRCVNIAYLNKYYARIKIKILFQSCISFNIGK